MIYLRLCHRIFQDLPPLVPQRGRAYSRALCRNPFIVRDESGFYHIAHAAGVPIVMFFSIMTKTL